ncbi:MAG: HD domain-containing protein [Oscillospiraceae bacterium]|jgi:HD superfamily phosphodiesterase|nr:HD domain-containing protein [Oscillospiraceae bacterium]
MLREIIPKAALAMAAYDAGAPKRIAHFMKVWGYARTIGQLENLDRRTQLVLELSALTHDIGIKNALEKYGDCSGEHQQEEGPPEAEKLLAELGYPKEIVQRVCWLIAHHHIYREMTSPDYQILVEADFLVNLEENGADTEAVRAAKEKIFRTEAGLQLLCSLFPAAQE